MLTITVPAVEGWDSKAEQFVDLKKEKKLQLEHSLVSLSKWESKWHKPFYSDEQMSDEETLDYIKCMTITQNVDDEVYGRLSQENINEIVKYIHDPMTATTFSNLPKGSNRGEKITAEILYYDMIALNIPFECQKWHINRLMTLIKVCDLKNKPPEKMSQREILSKQAALNAVRRKKHNTKG